MTPLEQITQFALREFQKALRKNLKTEWEPHHGRPPSVGYIVQNAYATDLENKSPALRAWRVTPDSILELTPIPGPSAGAKRDGMFYDSFSGSFGVSDDSTRVSINWLTGPRFGRGFIHTIKISPDGNLSFGTGQPTWMS